MKGLIWERYMSEEYREELAKRKGFKSHEEYFKFLIERRKEKLEEIGKRMEKYAKKPPEEILKKDEKVEKLIKKIEERTKKIEKEEREVIELEMIKKNVPKIQETIEFIPIREISRRRGAPSRTETTQKHIDRFESMTNLFQKKVHACNLNKIARDIIEAENLTRYIDKNTISLPNRSLAKYYRLLGQYKDSVKFLEKKCKCSPEK